MARESELWDRFEAALASQDYDGLASMYAPDGTYIEPAGHHEGRDAIRRWLDDWGHAFTGVTYKATLVVSDGDVIIAETTYHSVHTGPLTMADGSVMPATGKAIDTPGVTILRVKDAQIVTARDYIDQLGGLMQLGLMPRA
jgi:uncharacterized protein (TIGR02246 family)